MHTLILGFDAFDPAVFERLSEQGKLPNLTKALIIRGCSDQEIKGILGNNFLRIIKKICR